MRKRTVWRNERGVTLVLMAITIVLTLSMAAMAIDYGKIKSARAEAQRAMDAASLAGASAFQAPGAPAADSIEAIARVNQWVVKNVVAGKYVKTSQVDSIRVVMTPLERVDVWYTSAAIPLWFANIFGTSNMSVKAHSAAIAEVGGISTNCLKPFLIPDIWQETSVGPGGEDKNSNRYIDGTGSSAEKWNYVPTSMGGTDRYLKFDPKVYDNPASPQTGYGSPYRNNVGYPNDKGLPFLMKPQLGNNESRHGNWYYTLDGPGQNLREDIETGCISANVGDPPTLATGGKTGQARQGVQYLFDQDPYARWDSASHQVISTYGENSPRVIIVGLFDPIYIKGTSRLDKPDPGVTFNNFAKIFIDTRPSGNDDINGRFVGFLPSSGPGGPVSCSNCKVLRLVE